MTIAEQIKVLEVSLLNTNLPEQQAQIILDILNLYARTKNPQSNHYCQLLTVLSERTGDQNYKAWALYHQSLSARFASDFIRSLDLSKKARAIFIQNNQKYGAANCLNNIGNVYSAMGSYAESLQNHLEALRLRLEIEDKNGIANSYTNIAVVQYYMENFEEALDYNERSKALMTEMGNIQGVSNNYINIGNICLEKGDLEKALENYRFAYKLETETENLHGKASLLCNMGTVYRKLGLPEDALRFFTDALELFEQLNNSAGQVLILNNLGKVAFDQANYEEAIRYHILALDQSAKIGAREENMLACEGLSEAYKAQGNFKKALELYHEFHALSINLAGLKVKNQIVQLKFQHDLAIVENEAKFLREKNEAIELYLNKLEQSNEELHRFAHVASHDLREPLRMVTSYLRLLDEKISETSNEGLKQFIRFALEGSKRMELLILDLLRLAKVGADLQIGLVDLNQLVIEVQNNLEILVQENKAVITATHLPLIKADRSQILQLMQNLVSNGIKYNESATPLVAIDFRTDEDAGIITVSDNGIGIPEIYREKAFMLFQRLPSSVKKEGTGLGLAICKKIVDALGGTISINDNEGEGTIFTLRLPNTVIGYSLQ